MSPTSLREVLEQMPEIAEAVNAFDSEVVQQQAFALLTRSLVDDLDTTDTASEQHIDDSNAAGKQQPAERSRGGKSAQGTSKKPQSSSRSTQPKFVSDLDLQPKGSKSLRDFVSEKKPQDNQERFAVISYYLRESTSVEKVSYDHIYTAFKDLNVPAPKDISSALRTAATRKGWLDTSDLSNIILTVPGENFVEHDLPDTEEAEK